MSSVLNRKDQLHARDAASHATCDVACAFTRQTLMKRSLPVLLLLLWLLLASACAAEAPDQEPLRIAVLPILDSLPIFVAEQEGFFAEQGVAVELIPVASAPERDQFMQAGQIDGMINELVSTFFYNQDEIRISIVRFARVATTEAPVSGSSPLRKAASEMRKTWLACRSVSPKAP